MKYNMWYCKTSNIYHVIGQCPTECSDAINLMLVNYFILKMTHSGLKMYLDTFNNKISSQVAFIIIEHGHFSSKQWVGLIIYIYIYMIFYWGFISNAMIFLYLKCDLSVQILFGATISFTISPFSRDPLWIKNCINISCGFIFKEAEICHLK